MNKFDIKRFWQTLCWVVVENWRTLALWTATFSLGALLAEFFFIVVMHQPYEACVSVGIGVCAFFLMLAVLVSISCPLTAFDSKQRRIALFSLPASNLEKFLAVIVYASVINVVAIFVAFAVGDTLRMLVFPLLYKDCGLVSGVQAMLTSMLNFIKGLLEVPWQVALLNGLMLVWTHSVSTLGGTLFRKWSFVIVSAVLMILSLCFSMLMVVLVEHGLVPGDYISIENMKLIVSWLGYLGIMVLAALSVFNYLASYRIFTRMQVESRRWLNV